MHLNGYCTCLSPMFDFSLGSAVFMVFSAQEIPARCFPSSKWLEGEGSGPATFVARPLGWNGPETSRFGGFVMDHQNSVFCIINHPLGGCPHLWKPPRNTKR
jgi:hypothetical protein